jgi:hypothetical protein
MAKAKRKKSTTASKGTYVVPIAGLVIVRANSADEASTIVARVAATTDWQATFPHRDISGVEDMRVETTLTYREG